jgi:hypothetical protein
MALMGYEHDNIDNSRLSEWMTLTRLHLIYSPKDNGTFKSTL